MDGVNGMEYHQHGMPPGHSFMMNMTFFWGKSSDILFSGLPGTSSGMYFLALIFVFVLAVLVELLSHSKFIKPDSNHIVASLFLTFLHAIRFGLAYLLMLAVMSFNGGIFLAAVAGHAMGFFLFGSRNFDKSTPPPPLAKVSDVPSMSC